MIFYTLPLITKILVTMFPVEKKKKHLICPDSLAARNGHKRQHTGSYRGWRAGNFQKAIGIFIK